MVSPSASTPVTGSRAHRARGLVLLALLGALVAFAGVFGAPPSAASATVSAPVACQARAGETTLAVVVDFGGGRVRTRCAEAGGSGVEVLRRAGFAPITQSYGSVGGDSAVCAITDPDTGSVQGCESGASCLTCLAPDSWGYFPGYRYSQIGAGETQPGAGTVEAWRWGRATSWGGAKPSVADVCGEPEPEPTPTTAPPSTRPPGGSGIATPVPGGRPDPGAGDGGGSTDGGGSPQDPGASSTTTGPGGSSTTAPGATTTAPGATDDEATTTEAAVVEDGAVERPSGDDEEHAAGLPGGPSTGSDGDGGGGSGAPVVPLAVTALVVAVVAGLALRARRARAATPPTSPTGPPAPA